MNAVELITAARVVVQGALALGLSLTELFESMRKADAEGREFGPADLKVLADKRRESQAKLDNAIKQAEAALNA